MAETEGFYLRGTSVSELSDGQVIQVIGYDEDGDEFDRFDVVVVRGVADIERTAAQVAAWPDIVKYTEVVATTSEGLVSSARTPTLVRSSSIDTGPSAPSNTITSAEWSGSTSSESTPAPSNNITSAEWN